MVDIISKEELERAFDSRFPAETKAKLADARVAVAGLGGLGSNIAVMLARSGVGHLFLVDFDVVDVTNLNRQAYSASHIGKPKTEAIKDIIAEINPYLDVEVCCKTVDENNAEELFGSYDIVCEAFDRAETNQCSYPFLSACPKCASFRETEWRATETATIYKRKKYSSAYTYAEMERAELKAESVLWLRA